MLLLRFELPVLKRLVETFDDAEQFQYWAELRASRESKNYWLNLSSWHFP